MKKIYYFLSLMLAFFVSSTVAIAQEYDEFTSWDLSEEPVQEVHDGMLVALQQGTYAAWSQNKYMNHTGTFKAEVDASCVYKMVQVDELTENGVKVPIYVFENVDNKQYIYSGGHTLSFKDAFQCSAMVARITEDVARDRIQGPDRQSADAEGTCMVFASKEPNTNDGGEVTGYTYLCYWSCPAYSSYTDTNDWFVYEVTPRAMEPTEKVSYMLAKCFPDGCDPDVIPVGSDPGCVPQSTYDAIQLAVDKAGDAVMNEAGEEECNACVDELRAAYELYLSTMAQVVPGKFYYFVNRRSQDMCYEDGSNNLKCTAGYSELPEVLTVDQAKYIFSVEAADENYVYIKNFATGNYWDKNPGTSAQWKTKKEGTEKFQIIRYAGMDFNFRHSSGNYNHNDGGQKVVQWNSPAGDGCRWGIKEVKGDVASLEEELAHNRFLAEYASYISEAKSVAAQYLHISGYTEDSKYAEPGLVETATTNAQCASEGPIANAFDGNLESYFHTEWSGNLQTGDYDWMQVDLGKEIQDIVVKFSMRHNNFRGAPSHVRIQAKTEADELSGIWTKDLFNDTVIYEYPGPNTSYRDSSTCIIKIHADEPVQYLRFGATDNMAHAGRGSGEIYWHLSEIRFYEDNGEVSPKYLLIPEELRNGLADQIAHSLEVVGDSTATEADLEALKAAVEAFEAAYPDDSNLSALMADAKHQAEAEGMEGEGWGYFPVGSQAELSSAIEAISAEIEGKTLTLEQIAEKEAAVNAIVDAYNAKLIVPEDGTFVRIKGQATNDDEEPVNANGDYVYAANADSVKNIRWGYEDAEDKDSFLQCIWQVKKMEGNKFAFRNVFSGKYMSNIYEGVADEDVENIDRGIGMKSVEAPQGFDLLSAARPGMFSIKLANGRFLNGASGGEVVIWIYADNNGRFTLEPVEDELELSDFVTSVRADEYQVVTLPFEIVYADPLAYKVIGQNEGKLQLVAYGDDETIPAGTPFVVDNTGTEGLERLNFGIASTLGEMTSGKYEYGHITQNGLVGTLNSFKMEAGFGLLIDNVVKNSVKDYTIAAGSGYFTAELPETTEVGDIEIDIKDTITGTGIANVIAGSSKNVNGVYTISGVKVSNNGSTNNLPKGLYIVGGKKVIVK